MKQMWENLDPCWPWVDGDLEVHYTCLSLCLGIFIKKSKKKIKPTKQNLNQELNHGNRRKKDKC